jgi:hypothetical protein
LDEDAEPRALVDGRTLVCTLFELRQQSNSAASIWIIDLESATPYTRLLELPAGPRIRGLTWTRDGTAVIIGKHDWTSDIVLMEQAGPPDAN